MKGVRECILDRRTVGMDDTARDVDPADRTDRTDRTDPTDAAQREELLHARLAIIEQREPRRALSPEERARRQRSDRALFELLQQLKCARMLAGYSQADLAKQLRTTASAISRLESGLYSRPTLTTIENYAQVLGYVVEIRLTRVRRPLATVPHMRFLC